MGSPSREAEQPAESWPSGTTVLCFSQYNIAASQWGSVGPEAGCWNIEGTLLVVLVTSGGHWSSTGTQSVQGCKMSSFAQWKITLGSSWFLSIPLDIHIGEKSISKSLCLACNYSFHIYLYILLLHLDLYLVSQECNNINWKLYFILLKVDWVVPFKKISPLMAISFLKLELFLCIATPLMMISIQLLVFKYSCLIISWNTFFPIDSFPFIYPSHYSWAIILIFFTKIIPVDELYYL